MLKICIVSIAVWTAVSAAQGYHELITHNNLDYYKCRNSYECGYDELCERVCFWQEKYQEFVGCKVTCVKKGGYDHPHGYSHKILPLPAPKPEYHPPAPTYKPAPAPYKPTSFPAYPPGQSYHKQVCYNDYECGYNRICNKYEKTCECKYGFEVDPDYHDRCIDTKPQYPAPAPHYPPSLPKPHQPYPLPAPHPAPTYNTKGYRACNSASDCYYGEKCCFWKKCNAYGNCATAYKCAKYCH